MTTTPEPSATFVPTKGKNDAKKIIDGKLYKANTAEYLGVYEYQHSSYDRRNFNYSHYFVYLYRTKNGQYFVVLDTCRREAPIGHICPQINDLTDGLHLITSDQARKIVEKCEISEAAYAYYFGALEEG